MPLYEFRCEDCGNKFSEIKRIGDNNAVCPECGSSNTKRMISTFASVSNSAGSASFSGGSNCGGGG
jgi:putative FmdB family regulatory protein